MNSQDFPFETDNTFRNRQNVYFNESKRRYKENEMKSSFFCSNLFVRKGEVSFFIPL